MVTSQQLISKHSHQLLLDASFYHIVVRVLQYCTFTSHEITFSVNKHVLSICSNSKLDTLDMIAKRLHRYLKGTSTYGLMLYQSQSLNLTAYADINWASSNDDNRSIGGYCIYLGHSLVSWNSGSLKVHITILN